MLSKAHATKLLHTHPVDIEQARIAGQDLQIHEIFGNACPQRPYIDISKNITLAKYLVVHLV